MPFVWYIGTIVGPAVGGTLARPATSISPLVSSTSIFATFPYLLPNLICAALLLFSIVFGYFFLRETHPNMQVWSTQQDLDSTVAETPLMTTAGAIANSATDLLADTYGTFNTVEITEEKQWLLDTDGTSRPPSISSKSNDEPKIFTRKVVMLVVALCIFAYHSMSYDHLLPIFLQDERISPKPNSPFAIPGGLGLSTQSVGIIMSFNGVIALSIQAIVFPLFATYFGIWKTFVLVTILHPLAYIIVPFLAFISTSTLYPALYTCLMVRNFTSILAYPVLLIMLKEATSPPSALGKVNGLAASTAAACRTLAPPVAGFLYTIGSQIGFTGLAWLGSALVAVVGAFQIFAIRRTKNKTATLRPMASFIRPIMHEENNDEVVHIVVNERVQEV